MLRRDALLAFACAAALNAYPSRAAAIPRPSHPPTIDPTYALALPRDAPRQPAASGVKWIWTQAVRDSQKVRLVKSFDAGAHPRSARFVGTADDFFTLSINAKVVHATHADPHNEFVWRQAQIVDILPFVRPGMNTVTLEAENVGGAAGAAAQVEVDGKIAAATDASWLAEDVSANGAPGPPRVLGDLGVSPWTDITSWPGFSGGAPYLRHMTIYPVRITAAEAAGGVLDGVASLTGRRQRLAVTVRSGSPTPSLLVDFGKELSGRVVLGGTNVAALVGTGESAEEAMKSPWGGVHAVTDGAGTPYSAFRYAHITFQPGSGATQHIHTLVVDHDYYPVAYRGWFDCSDPILTQVWYTGAYTSHLCMQDDIWDAPKRDRARWMGDLHVSGEVINNVFADRFLMEQTMDRLRDEAQGGTAPGELPRSHVNGIPGYTCAWIAGLADFHRHVGDMAYLQRQRPRLLTMLEFMRGELDNRGVFVNTRKQWPFVDWAPEFNGETPLARAATHLFYVKAAREAAFLLQELGDRDNAGRTESWADHLAAAAREHLVDPNGLTYSDRRQENAMAIYSGTATPAQTAAIYDRILRPGAPAWSIIATPYYNNYVLYAMSLAGHTDDAVSIVRSYWGEMLREGATTWWEGYDPKWTRTDFHAHLEADNGTGYFVSLCHGWSAGPTNLLTERVLGIRPTSGGFRTAEIAPELGDLKWAAGAVPTPGGLLEARVEQSGAEWRAVINVPAGVTVRVALPANAEAGQTGSARGADGRYSTTITKPGSVVIRAHLSRERSEPKRT